MNKTPEPTPAQVDPQLLRADASAVGAGAGSEHQRMLALLISSTEQGIWFIDNEQRTTDANPAMCRILGCTLAQMLGRSIYSFVDEANAEIFREHVRRRALGQAESYEIALLHSAGHLVPCWNNATPIYDAQGHKIGAVGMFSDISSLKRVEGQLRQTTQRLAEQTHTLAVTLNSLRQGVVSMGPDGRALAYNQRLLELVQLPESLMKQRPTPEEALRWQIEHGHYSAAEGDRLLANLYHRVPHYRRVRSDGVVLDVDTHYAADGSSVRTFTDVTDAVRAEAALTAAKDEAERANHAKSEFLSRMSHELRTPLNAVLGFAQLMQSDSQEPLGPLQQGRLQELQRGARHLLSLINDVLDLSRIEAGGLPVALGPVDVAELADECLSLMASAALARPLRLQLRAGDQACPAVQADPVRLRQVLLNLLSNAIKYTPPGGSVWLSWAPHAGGVRLEVGDTGPGLSAHQQERLFQPFERLDAAHGGVEGAGIGLALSKWLVGLMHGELGVQSTPGQGSVFWVQLAAAATAAVARPAAAQPGAPSQPPGPVAQSPAPVLYIEDNEVNRILMEGMLAREAGVQLHCAALPEEGLLMAQRLLPRLVLLDIQLPGIDGHEVLRRLRLMPALAQVPVVAVSANAMPSDRAKAAAAGFADYITKPVDMPLLLATVRRLLGPTG
jgi:PAS domain S-box-containing protein